MIIPNMYLNLPESITYPMKPDTDSFDLMKYAVEERKTLLSLMLMPKIGQKVIGKVKELHCL